MKLPIMSHPKPYTIGWLSHGQDIHVSQQCHLSYNVKTFSNKVLCDVAPLEVCDVLLEQPYMWNFYVVYESQTHSVVFTLGDQFYRIPKVVSTITKSLISAKQCKKVISHTYKFVLSMIRLKGEQQVTELS